MENVLIISIIYFVGIFILLIANEWYYRHLGIKGEYSRKFAHITATLATLPFPYIIPSHWYILALALIFFVVLYLDRKSTRLNSSHVAISYAVFCLKKKKNNYIYYIYMKTSINNNST